MKLGCVFTQTTTDPEGFPIRDPETTTFVGAIEPAEQFGKRIYAEAVRRGLPNAEKVVVLGDGAEWIKNLAELHFPEAIQIVDLREHVSDLCKIRPIMNLRSVSVIRRPHIIGRHRPHEQTSGLERRHLCFRSF